ncbi:hypothetical protein mRhiFer1_008679 [Rhinolophus ferrumequinum]|uniref:Uncharacterized protein n=1 Tax=Rhinolophus ferrumequinum TaxID=59479 RepID=A0A7J7TRB4_RHIFE|nr:hypothetical protein mRhiFer1_008679 [Rhinolophus ferrumequinum]
MLQGPIGSPLSCAPVLRFQPLPESLCSDPAHLPQQLFGQASYALLIQRRPSLCCEFTGTLHGLKHHWPIPPEISTALVTVVARAAFISIFKPTWALIVKTYGDRDVCDFGPRSACAAVDA